MAKMVTVACEYCGVEREVREADVKRGWGRFCSKSHAAMNNRNRDSGKGTKGVYRGEMSTKKTTSETTKRINNDIAEANRIAAEIKAKKGILPLLNQK